VSALLVGHIICALTSLTLSAVMAVRPSHRGLHVAYGLVAVTLASGTWLVIALGQPLTSACMTGLVYLSFVSAGLIRARQLLY
jgi:hypothetical protein